MNNCLQALDNKHSVFCRMPGCDKFAVFEDACDVLHAYSLGEVLELTALIEEKISLGFYVAAFFAYEAAPAFDQAMKVKKYDDFPLASVMFFKTMPRLMNLSDLQFSGIEYALKTIPGISRDEYLRAVMKAKHYICEGDIYQCNMTFRTRIPECPISERSLFLETLLSHPVPFPAFFNFGSFKILSFSPELFLEKTANSIRTEPMKGTAKRALTLKDDINSVRMLSQDKKNRAENLMIVDMSRNDLGRISSFGSIKADELFAVKTFRTVHQMTSTISSELRPGVSLTDIMTACFPAASITGAPKIKAMEIIESLEKTPRKAYTGCSGVFTPCGDFLLNVLIRTVTVQDGKTAELGIGSGIVADSVAGDEWDECILKSTFATVPEPEFEVLETMLADENANVSFEQKHLKRAFDSQKYFLRPFDQENVRETVRSAARNCKKPSRLRLLIGKDGSCRCESTELKFKNWGTEKLKILLSGERTRSTDIYLYHKTTNREFYNLHFKEAVESGYDEIIFLNMDGFLTEGAISNIFVLYEDRWITAPVSCGLLDGIWRGEMMKKLCATEELIDIDILSDAQKILVGNSVRGSCEAAFVEDSGGSMIFHFKSN